MSKVFVSDTYLSNIADAIRAKNGAQTQYYPREMAAAITALDVEEHKPIQVNIQQSEHQTIKVKVKQKELNNTTINTNVELPETIQLEATVVANEGYTPGTLNQSLVDAEWGDTVTFSATEATVAIVEPETIDVTIAMDNLSLTQGEGWPTITYNVVGWPNDTNDILNITTDTSNAQQTIGSHPASEFINYTVTYNDDPRKYNYNITMTGNATVESAPEPSDPGPAFEKYVTFLSSQDISIREGKNAVITARISPSDAFGTVEAIDSDTNQILKTESINNSKARIVISGLTRGKHRIILNYIGNDMYLPSSTYSLVTVTAS